MLISTFIAILIVTITWAAPDGRIVGGQVAVLGQFPHQILLRRNDQFTCGGFVISADFVLTAAHCVVPLGDGSPAFPAEQFLVVAGSVEQDVDSVTRKVSQVIVHESYDKSNDIALLKLSEPLEFSDTVQPVELFNGEVPTDSDVTISGFGRVDNGGPASPVLKYNTLKAVSPELCTKITGLDGQIMCLGHKKGNGACNGDSGGPALYEGKLVGVANFVLVKCGTSFPDGYASVPYYYNWIVKNANLSK